MCAYLCLGVILWSFSDNAVISNAYKSSCVQHVDNVIMAYFVLLVPKKITCVNFENTCALNSPIFLSIVKKSLDYFSQFVVLVSQSVLLSRLLMSS